MATVRFTANLQRHVECPETTASGATLREVLEAVFARHPRARGYVLDEHGAMRHHMVVFIDGAMARDRAGLGDAVAEDSQVWIMQALSGG